MCWDGKRHNDIAVTNFLAYTSRHLFHHQQRLDTDAAGMVVFYPRGHVCCAGCGSDHLGGAAKKSGLQLLSGDSRVPG
jgi:hypothetical protein